MADKKTDKKKQKAKDGKQKGKGGGEAAPYSSVATHPRASVRVRQAKGWGGLAGFAIAAVLSLKASVPAIQVLERAILFGVAGYLVAWALSLLVWRQLMIAEQRAALDEIKRRREAARSPDDEIDQGRPRPAAGGGNPGPG